MANVLKRDREKRRKQVDATMRQMRQQNHMQAKRLVKRIVDICYNDFNSSSSEVGCRVGSIWVGSEPLFPQFGWRDDVFRRGVEIISKALWNCFQLGKEDEFVIELGYEYEYDELTWQDWMRLRYKITPNPNLNDLDDTRRRETLKHLLPSGSPDVLPDEWPWDYEIRTDLVAKIHNKFSDSNTVLIFKEPYARDPGVISYGMKIIFRLYPNLPAGDQDLKHIVRKWIKRNPYPRIDQDGVPEQLRVDHTFQHTVA